MTDPRKTGRPNPFLCGLRSACPNCGEGPLFVGYLRVADRCEACGQDLTRADSGDGPVVFILLIVGTVCCGGLLFTELALQWPVWLELVIWLPLSVLMTLAVLRPFKATMIALQFFNNASEAGGLE